MWKLSGSRSQFYVDCGRPEENFWKTLFEQAGRRDLIDDPKYKEFLEWKPESSNCPELQNVAAELVNLAPIEWRATMKNIFVARAFKGDANAEASSFRSAGIVEINHGLTMAAMIYSTLFCHFYASVKSAATQVDFSYEDEDVTQMIIDELERSAFEPILVADQSISKWEAERNVYAAHPLLVELPAGRADSEYHKLVTAAEMFVVAHEFCHHMLGHTEEHFKHAERARKVVREQLARIDSAEIIEELNTDQRQEIEADVAAFLLICGFLSENLSRPRIYRAIGGSMVALVALAHVNESWASSGADSTHPGILERYEILSKLIKEMTMDLPIGEGIKDHPIGFLIQFRAFISVVLQTIASRMGGDVPAPNFLNIFSWMIDCEAEFKEEYRAHHQGKILEGEGTL